MDRRILVIAETKDNEPRNVTFEAIAAAKQIEESGKVIAVLCGHENLEEAAQEIIYHGADEVITIKHSNLTEYTSEGYGHAVLSVIKELDPYAIVMGHTAIGKDLTPMIASKLESGLISDVIRIEHDHDRVVFTRPIYSGKAFEKKIITNGLVFVTIRPNNIERLERDESRCGDVKPKEVEITSPKVLVKEVIRKPSEGVDLSEAKVVIAGGRGLKSAKGFDPLYELADLLGGAVGASRGACDANYCDYALQIGQTGKVITPDLYIAVGISGAIQHVAGMSNSKVIVAINKDPEATIFSMADYGIVGDLFTVLPLLIKELKK